MTDQSRYKVFDALSDNTFLHGNADAPEHEVYEIITLLMGYTTRIRTSYYAMKVVYSAMLEGEADGSIINYINTQLRNISSIKLLMYKILTSIPHSDTHDVF